MYVSIYFEFIRHFRSVTEGNVLLFLFRTLFNSVRLIPKHEIIYYLFYKDVVYLRLELFWFDLWIRLQKNH